MGYLNPRKSLALSLGLLTLTAFQNCGIQAVIMRGNLPQNLSSVKSIAYTSKQPELSLVLHANGGRPRAILTMESCQIDAPIDLPDFVKVAQQIEPSPGIQELREPFAPQCLPALDSDSDAQVRVDHTDGQSDLYTLDGPASGDVSLDNGEEIEQGFLELINDLKEQHPCEEIPTRSQGPYASVTYHQKTFPLASAPNFSPVDPEDTVSYPLTSTSITIKADVGDRIPWLSGKVVKYQIQSREDLASPERWQVVCEEQIANEPLSSELVELSQKVSIVREDHICMIGLIYLGPGERPSITTVDKQGRSHQGYFFCTEQSRAHDAEDFVKKLSQEAKAVSKCLDSNIEF